MAPLDLLGFVETQWNKSDLRVARREHMVIPILVHTAAAGCELESKVLPTEENVIGPKIDSKAGTSYRLCIQNRELPFLVDPGTSGGPIDRST